MVDERWQDMRQGVEDLDAIIAESGRRAMRRQPNAAYVARLAEAAEFLDDVLSGRRSMHYLQEALSTSDFPLLMGDILDRQLLGRYNEITPTWQNYCKRGLVRDFRTVRRIARGEASGRYYPNYKQAEYAGVKQDDNIGETGYTYSVEVYEKAIAINWQMLINDDLGAFRDLPLDLARGARRTEEYFATTLFVDTTGPHASLYTGGNANVVTSNPVLSITALQTAFTVLAAQTDANGEPILIDAVELVVPPALEITALNILNAVQLWLDTNASAGTAQQNLVTVNWMRNRVNLSVNPYIPIVASSSNGSTSWFLFANPNNGRPALEMGFMAGYETPGIYQKAPNTMRVGGSVDPSLGDFDSHKIKYKGMHILGGTRLDPKMTVASSGAGS